MKDQVSADGDEARVRLGDGIDDGAASYRIGSGHVRGRSLAEVSIGNEHERRSDVEAKFGDRGFGCS